MGIFFIIHLPYSEIIVPLPGDVSGQTLNLDNDAKSVPCKISLFRLKYAPIRHFYM
ncbi:MAG: hypothetical protein GY795_05115 [Desulfobacterales bacterium]|nr:hypothetical protein [Desulfobacterales bacterium]